MKVQSQVLVQDEQSPYHGRAGQVTKPADDAGAVTVALDALQDGTPSVDALVQPANLRTLLAG